MESVIHSMFIYCGTYLLLTELINSAE